MKYQAIGFIAAFLTTLKIIPNLYNVIIKKSTNGFSYFYMCLGLLAQICWLFFSIHNNNIPLIITSIYLLICYILLTVYKYYYEKYKLNVLSQIKLKNSG